MSVIPVALTFITMVLAAVQTVGFVLAQKGGTRVPVRVSATVRRPTGRAHNDGSAWM